MTVLKRGLDAVKLTHYGMCTQRPLASPAWGVEGCSTSNMPWFTAPKEEHLPKLFFDETGEDGLLVNNLWYLRTQEGGSHIFQKKQLDSSSSMIHLRERRIMPCAAEDVLAKLAKIRPWLPHFLQVKEIEHEHNRSLTYVVIKGFAGGRPRDLFVEQRNMQLDQFTSGIFYTTGEERAGEFVMEGCVRSELWLSGYVVRADELNPNRCTVIYLLQHDFKPGAGWFYHFHCYQGSLLALERSILPPSESTPLASDSNIWMDVDQRYDMMQLARKLKERSKEDLGSESHLQLVTMAEVEEREESFDYPLEQILNDTICRMFFGRYLDLEYCRENLSFWEAVENLKQKSYVYETPSSHDPEELNSRLALEAETLYKAYVAGRTPTTINLSSDLRESIRLNMQTVIRGEPIVVRQIFDEAVDVITMMLRQGPYQRFLKSTVYADMLHWLDQNGFHVYERMLAAFQQETQNTLPTESVHSWLPREYQEMHQFTGVFRKKFKGYSCYQERGILPVTPETIIEMTSKYDAPRHSWDPKFLSAQVILDIGEAAKVLRVVYEGPLLRRSRDMCVLWITCTDAFDQQYVLWQSVNNSDCPVRLDHRRIDVMISGIRAGSLPNKHCAVLYLRQVGEGMEMPYVVGRDQMLLDGLYRVLQSQVNSGKLTDYLRARRVHSSDDIATETLVRPDQDKDGGVLFPSSGMFKLCRRIPRTHRMWSTGDPRATDQDQP
eukprot:Ihof_evm11s107 gene=Ihof_evmTU11s107